jgi:hypothetical protein
MQNTRAVGPRGGRFTTEGSGLVGVRLDQELLAKIDAFAKRYNVKFSGPSPRPAAIRKLLERALTPR